MFQETELPIPLVSYASEEVHKNIIETGSLWLGRKASHSSGTDITWPGQKAFNQADYWIRFVPDIVREWRFHIVNDKSIQRQVKIHTDTTVPWKPIRNRKTGWTLSRQTQSLDIIGECRELAKKAVKAVGYDFGAVDIMEDYNGKLYLLEVNRCPGLDDHSAELYVKAFVKWANSYE